MFCTLARAWSFCVMDRVCSLYGATDVCCVWTCCTLGHAWQLCVRMPCSLDGSTCLVMQLGVIRTCSCLAILCPDGLHTCSCNLLPVISFVHTFWAHAHGSRDMELETAFSACWSDQSLLDAFSHTSMLAIVPCAPRPCSQYCLHALHSVVCAARSCNRSC